MHRYGLHYCPESGNSYKLALTIRAWLDRVAALPRWVAPYDLLPGQRLRYA